MQLGELTAIIQAAGGGCGPLEYAEALLQKINCLEDVGGRYESMLAQLRSAKEQGDFRGRVLEVNFAYPFLEAGIGLQYGAKQGMQGDVDFCWCVNEYQVFIEMKLLGQDKKSREAINQQLEDTGFYGVCIRDDTPFDVARIQRDIFGKSSIKKFNPKPKTTWINLVAVDVSELQLGTVDIGDCLLATVGNEITSRYYHSACSRPAVVGVFEPEGKALNPDQIAWVKCFHKVLIANEPHPRDYIHGVLFLFRDPKERAALSYHLSAAVVWNPGLIDDNRTRKIVEPFHQIVPLNKK